MREPFYSYLEEQFLDRKKKNPSYSLRAFSRLLGVDQSSLSKALKGRRSFSPDTIKTILQKLKASSDIYEIFEREFRNRGSHSRQLTEEEIITLCHWKYWALLELIKISPSYSPATMAEKLELEEKEVKSRLNLLQRLGFIESHKKGYRLLKPNNNWISTEKTSLARRKLQKQYLKLSLAALEDVPFAERDHSSMTVAIDPKRMPEIRKKIAKFHDELGNFCQKKGKLDEVYQMTISFFPLTKRKVK